MTNIVQSGFVEMSTAIFHELVRPVMCRLFSSDENERNFTCFVSFPLQEASSIKQNYLDFIRFMLQVGVVN